MKTINSQNSAFVLVDYQNDFVDPRGSLYVKGSEVLLETIGQIICVFDAMGAESIATKDWHPRGHVSFASTFGQEPFSQVDGELKWPDHCVADCRGAQLYGLSDSRFSDIVLKGTKIDEDAYSGFKGTDLQQYLQRKLIKNLFVGGVATDYCVDQTVLDASKLGYDVYVLNDAIKAVFPENQEKTFENWKNKGIQIISLDELKKIAQ